MMKCPRSSSYEYGSVSDMACEVLPAPNELTSEKIQNLLCSGVTSIEQLPPETQDLKTGLLKLVFLISHIRSVKIFRTLQLEIFLIVHD